MKREDRRVIERVLREMEGWTPYHWSSPIVSKWAKDLRAALRLKLAEKSKG